MNDYITPAQAKRIKALAVAREGIAIANRSNPFWNKSAAFTHYNLAMGNSYV